MSTNKVLPTLSTLLASALVLTGCVFGYEFSTPASCTYTPIGGGDPVEIPLEVNFSDQSPDQNADLTITVFPADYELPAGLTMEDAQDLVIVDHAVGPYVPGGVNAVDPQYSPGPSASASFDPSFVGIPVSSPSPTPSSSLDPSFDPSATPSPEETGTYEAPTSESNARVFMTLPDVGPNAWFSTDTSMAEKLGLEGIQNSNDFVRLSAPGIISVRCAEDPKGTIRAAKAIYPGYLDTLSPLTVQADSNQTEALTGTLTFPVEVPATGYVTGYLFQSNPDSFRSEYIDSIGALWLTYLQTESTNAGASGMPYLALGSQDDNGINNFSYTDRQIDYKIGIYGDNWEETDVRPAAGEYWFLAGFTAANSDYEVSQTAFFRVTISETGNAVEVETLSNFGLDIGSTPEPIEPAAVASTISPSITSVLPAKVSVAGGTKVTVKGSFLSGASVMVGDKPAALVSNTDGSIEFITPPSAAGKLGVIDVKLNTYAGAVTVQDGLTYEKAGVASAAVKPVVRKIDGFSGGSYVILPSQKAQLKRIGVEAAKFTSATCVGYVRGGMLNSSDRVLASNRAKAICASLKSANPSLKVQTSISPTNNGLTSAARKVDIKLSR